MKPITAKEKAIEILNDMAWVCRDNGNYPEVAKQCAIIAIDLAILYAQDNIYRYNSKLPDKQFLLEVKQELNKL